MANFIMGLISLSVGVVVLSGVFLTTVNTANTSSSCVNRSGWEDNVSTTCTSWSTAELALWGLLTIAAIAGMVYGVLNIFGLT